MANFFQVLEREFDLFERLFDILVRFCRGLFLVSGFVSPLTTSFKESSKQML